MVSFTSSIRPTTSQLLHLIFKPSIHAAIGPTYAVASHQSRLNQKKEE